MSQRPPRPDVQARPRGTGYVTPVWSGDRWKFKARFPDGAGGERTVGTLETEERAHQVLNGHVEARARRLIQPAGVIFYDFGERWIETLSDKNKRSWRSTWKTVVSAAPFAQWPIDAITADDVDDWTADLLEHISPRTGKPISRSTAKHALGLVRRCFDAAVKPAKLISASPAADAELPPSDDPDDDPAWTYLSQEEIVALLECPDLPPKQRAAFAIAIYAGLRQGELAALTWERVDLREDRPRLTVAASWGTRTKTRRTRLVSLIPAARAALHAWWVLQGRPAAGLVWPSDKPGQRGMQVRHGKGYDWGWSDTRDNAAGVCWLGWRRRVGIARRVRFHDLRHTCATHMVSGSWGRLWTLEEVQAVLGHTSKDTTQRYAHHAQTALDKAAAATIAIRPESVRAIAGSDARGVQQVATLLAEIVQRAVRDSNARPSAPELNGSRGPARSCDAPNGSRTDPLAMLDRLRRGEVDRAEGEAFAAAVIAASTEAVRAAGAVLAAPDAEFCARLLTLLELVLLPAAVTAYPAPTTGSRDA